MPNISKTLHQLATDPGPTRLTRGDKIKLETAARAIDALRASVGELLKTAPGSAPTTAGARRLLKTLEKTK